MSLCVRANRYALAKASGAPLPGDRLALHGCDIPLCVRVSLPGELGQLHIVAGSQRDNMIRMGRMGRGGGRRPIRRRNGREARRALSLALREAVRDGWDRDAIQAALLGSTDPTLW
ncbi:MAG: hypothetical protein JWR32_2638 [Mycobacterium sp.]|jgi:hypothetical protein|nr:hypothetical protein [Mycobacterium sp.]